ncbi:MAG: hypothetical protein A2341_04495 [Deltaproteobacteria bacterium RIFOXYB12_FULL_58_9]|nr:MAG: hypothetical protein A2341_04495 [Deltaproteobacteria bacterium RIFOXYB12_FULL_58_9]
MVIRNLSILVLVCAMPNALLAAQAAASAGLSAEPVGRVVALSGAVAVQRSDASMMALARGDYVEEGDIIETQEASNVRLLMRDKSVLALAGNSRFEIASYSVQPKDKRRKAKLKILVGKLWAFVTEAVHPDATYQVETANAVAGVRGTELVFDVAADGASQLTVIEGEVEVDADGTQETLGARESGNIGNSDINLKTTSEEEIANLREGVRPEQQLDTEKAVARVAATRKKSENGDRDSTDAHLREEGQQRAEGDEPGTGDSVFEDVVDGGNRNSADGGPALEFFDSATMARVRVRVEVRQ